MDVLLRMPPASACFSSVLYDSVSWEFTLVDDFGEVIALNFSILVTLKLLEVYPNALGEEILGQSYYAVIVAILSNEVAVKFFGDSSS